MGSEEPLVGDAGLPLRLFGPKGRPLTDYHGRPLKDFWGRPLVVRDRAGLYVDREGREAVDWRGRPAGRWGYTPEGAPPPPSGGGHARAGKNPKVSAPLFDFSGLPVTDPRGFPLIDAQGRPLLLLDPRGDPLVASDGQKVISTEGDMVTESNKLALSSHSGKPLRLFDGEKRPLTDGEGFPLVDLVGGPVVRGDVRDAGGRTPSHPGFDPTARPPDPDVPLPGPSPELLFDAAGFPLTDPDGRLLLDSEGRPVPLPPARDLVVISKADYHPHKLRSLRNCLGLPAVLFDRWGKPVLGPEGEPLRDAGGRLRLRVGRDCLPGAGEAFDSRGRPLGHPRLEAFPPRTTAPLYSHTALMDATGRPLTTSSGRVLLGPKGEPLVRFSDGLPSTDASGLPLFDERGLPVVFSLERPLLSPRGTPLFLFDSRGDPLTDRCGYAVHWVNGEPAVEVRRGRLVGAARDGGPLRDRFGVSGRASAPRSRPPHPPLRPVHRAALYSKRGLQLTDHTGTPLVDSKGRPLVSYDPAQSRLTDRDGNGVFDLRGEEVRGEKKREECGGRVYSASDGRPLTDDRGRVLLSTGGRPLVSFRPQGGLLDYGNGRVVTRPRVSYSPPGLSFPTGLYDAEGLPLTDDKGRVLETLSGQKTVVVDPLTGKPESDYRGGGVWDEDGVPVTRIGGCWLSASGVPLRLFARCGRPLTDARGAPLTDSRGRPLLTTDSLGRPCRDFRGTVPTDYSSTPLGDYRFDREPPWFASLEDAELEVAAFDARGLPATDARGRGLRDASGKPLWETSPLYDALGLPLFVRRGEKLVSVDGAPLRLFDKSVTGGDPLTDRNGRVLGGDLGTGAAVDARGRELRDPRCDPTTPPPGEPRTCLRTRAGAVLRLYAAAAGDSRRPLTDGKGYLLVGGEGRGPLLRPSDYHRFGGCNVFDENGDPY